MTAQVSSAGAGPRTGDVGDSEGVVGGVERVKGVVARDSTYAIMGFILEFRRIGLSDVRILML